MRPMAEYPSDAQVHWESARSPFGDTLLYYERIFHFHRAAARFLQNDASPSFRIVDAVALATLARAKVHGKGPRLGERLTQSRLM